MNSNSFGKIVRPVLSSDHFVSKLWLNWVMESLVETSFDILYCDFLQSLSVQWVVFPTPAHFGDCAHFHVHTFVGAVSSIPNPGPFWRLCTFPRTHICQCSEQYSQPWPILVIVHIFMYIHLLVQWAVFPTLAHFGDCAHLHVPTFVSAASSIPNPGPFWWLCTFSHTHICQCSEQYSQPWPILVIGHIFTYTHLSVQWVCTFSHTHICWCSEQYSQPWPIFTYTYLLVQWAVFPTLAHFDDCAHFHVHNLSVQCTVFPTLSHFGDCTHFHIHTFVSAVSSIPNPGPFWWLYTFSRTHICQCSEQYSQPRPTLVIVHIFTYTHLSVQWGVFPTPSQFVDSKYHANVYSGLPPWNRLWIQTYLVSNLTILTTRKFIQQIVPCVGADDLQLTGQVPWCTHGSTGHPLYIPRSLLKSPVDNVKIDRWYALKC